MYNCFIILIDIYSMKLILWFKINILKQVLISISELATTVRYGAMTLPLNGES